MLRVTVELVPAGNEAAKRVLGVMQIANVGGTIDKADYEVTQMYPNGGGIGQRVKQVSRHSDCFKFLAGLLEKVFG